MKPSDAEIGERKLQGEYELLATDKIELPETGRPYNATDVSALVASIRAIGLQIPITVDCDADDGPMRYRLISGRHRLEAYRVLGRETIPARVVTLSDIDRRLWAISENLHRTELTIAGRSAQVAEWIRLTEARDQSFQAETIESKRTDGRGHRPESGVNAAARDLGITKSEAHRAVKIDGITQEAKDAAAAAGIKTQADLLKVASYADQDQVGAVVSIAAERAKRKQPQLTKYGREQKAERAKAARAAAKAPKADVVAEPAHDLKTPPDLAVLPARKPSREPAAGSDLAQAIAAHQAAATGGARCNARGFVCPPLTSDQDFLCELAYLVELDEGDPEGGWGEIIAGAARDYLGSNADGEGDADGA